MGAAVHSLDRHSGAARAIARKLDTENNVVVDPSSEIIVTAGAQEALMATLMTLLDPGDNALTPSHTTTSTRVTPIFLTAR